MPYIFALAVVLLGFVVPTTGSARTKVRPSGPRKVVLQFWGFTDRGHNTAGLEEQALKYAASHPGFTVRITTRPTEAHHDALAKALAGRGTVPDIVAVDSEQLSRFVAKPTDFVNLATLGAARYERNYLPWNWGQGVTADGQGIVGLPGDIGGLVIAYRADLFAKAGVAKTHAEMVKRLRSWDALAAACEALVAAAPPTKCLDSPMLVFDAVKNQGTERYVGRGGELLVDRNPQVRRAWDLAAKAARSGWTTNRRTNSPEWTAELQGGAFAMAALPLWELRAVESQAPATAGLWDVVPVPEGGGSTGGVHLVIPARSKFAEEAFDVLQTAVSPESQLAILTKFGNFPSSPSLFETPEVQNLTSAFFANAPIGRTYADAAKRLRPLLRGPTDRLIDREFANGLLRVAQGLEEPEVAWTSTMRAIAAARYA